MKQIPIARSSELIAQEFEEGLLLYDLAIHKAFSLNETSSIVWNLVDGKSTIDEIVSKSRLPREMVLFAFDELQKNNLLKEKVETGLPTDRKSRRKVLMQMGATALALPVIVSLVAPSAVHAQSGCPAQPIFNIQNPAAVLCTDPTFPGAGPNGSNFCSNAGCTQLFSTACPSMSATYNGNCAPGGNSSVCSCTCTCP